VLAAGASSRLGAPKQLLRHRGETLVRRAVRCGLAAKPADAVVVLGAEAEAVFAAVADLPIRRVDADDWAAGMGASLRAGIAALIDEVDGALIVLCDQPAVDTAHLLALASAWRANPQNAAASSYAGVLGVPALLPRAWFTDLSGPAGDAGARALLAQRRDRVVAIVNPALARDVDGVADLDVLHED
jgi:CTP:molybdopterin cytidylyltransferase MocA